VTKAVHPVYGIPIGHFKRLSLCARKGSNEQYGKKENPHLDIQIYGGQIYNPELAKKCRFLEISCKGFPFPILPRNPITILTE